MYPFHFKDFFASKKEVLSRDVSEKLQILITEKCSKRIYSCSSLCYWSKYIFRKMCLVECRDVIR